MVFLRRLPEGVKEGSVVSSKNFNETRFFYEFPNSTAQPDHGVSEPQGGLRRFNTRSAQYQKRTATPLKMAGWKHFDRESGSK
jgi:hypothetical protein